MIPATKPFTKVVEIQRAEENFQSVILKLLNNVITFEEFEKSHKVLFNVCDEFGSYAKKNKNPITHDVIFFDK
ncbi:hypothetical protein ACRASX_15195 [Flavobacterium sp. TMP13]|uniref:hypothetical protein n=1 Tax=unclassified Flavobacterium TaxID=196869 RepID=UPI00076D3476|nr:hypothetical protein [Flavobacterium sp. TAB 87]KVV16255.1 hypothetical protein AP058_00190 [Flavobacterium sp. TAB 87]